MQVDPNDERVLYALHEERVVQGVHDNRTLTLIDAAIMVDGITVIIYDMQTNMFDLGVSVVRRIAVYGQSIRTSHVVSSDWKLEEKT